MTEQFAYNSGGRVGAGERKGGGQRGGVDQREHKENSAATQLEGGGQGEDGERREGRGERGEGEKER